VRIAPLGASTRDLPRAAGQRSDGAADDSCFEAEGGAIKVTVAAEAGDSPDGGYRQGLCRRPGPQTSKLEPLPPQLIFASVGEHANKVYVIAGYPKVSPVHCTVLPSEN
jgi:hypothetical protein